MIFPAERASQEDLQSRREMLVNYLQTVLQPDDSRLQALIADLREDLRRHPALCGEGIRRSNTTAH